MDNETLGAWVNAICNNTALKINEAIALIQLASYVTNGGHSLEDMFVAGEANIPIFRGMADSLNDIDVMSAALGRDFEEGVGEPTGRGG